MLFYSRGWTAASRRCESRPPDQRYLSKARAPLTAGVFVPPDRLKCKPRHYRPLGHYRQVAERGENVRFKWRHPSSPRLAVFQLLLRCKVGFMICESPPGRAPSSGQGCSVPSGPRPEPLWRSSE
jgi:hypothetical protein